LIKGNINAYKGKYSILNDADIVNFGEQSLVVLLTPGHTSGSICLMGEGFGFTGDTLFGSGGYGRYDLPTGNRNDLLLSLEKLLKYPDDFIIYSGHGASSTIKETKKYF
jgi:glyoxylase-like metal-dependent hydrolase (beta-lactamase superfamily II)